MKFTREQRWALAAALYPSVVGIALYVIFATNPPKQIEIIIPLDQPRVEHQGWVEPPPTLKAWAATQPQFQITGANGVAVNQDNEKLNVRLWLLVDLANGGRLPQIPQETGDCTSFGLSGALHATQGGQIAAGSNYEFKRIFPPFTYGAGRQWVWKKVVVGRLPNEGCSGAAVAQAAKEYGVLTWADAEAAGYKYSGKLADEWGRTGPPEKLKALAAKHRVKTVANVTTVDQVRDAICNGYGVTEASRWGNPGNKWVTQDGRIVGKRTGEWGHQMCIDGYDGSSPSGRKYFHIQNSWFPDSHPAPIDDSPVCGFWVEEADIEFMLAPGDCWAFSDFEGFPARLPELFPQTVNARPGAKEAQQRAKTVLAP